ncbi:uncharacterized protein LOC124439911 isoform X2 [Xenia sp. Carnegie-2017]|nr:uncharacterized protein LOC124439911 isoform X2 [Xenia sp. Carnegie-2017]
MKKHDWEKYLCSSTFSCLKTCLENHSTSKTAAFSKNSCFCTEISHENLNLTDGFSHNISELSIYKLTNFTVKFEFNNFVELGSKFRANRTIVLMYEDRVVIDSNTDNDWKNKLKNVHGKCELDIRKGNEIYKTSCISDIELTERGDYKISLGEDVKKLEKFTVLEKISMTKIETAGSYRKLKAKSMIKGTVYYLSLHLGDKREDVHFYRAYSELIYDVCRIDWNVSLLNLHEKYHGKQNLTILARNPLGEAKTTTELNFDCRVNDLKISHNVTNFTEGEINTKLTAYHNGPCNNVSFKLDQTNCDYFNIKWQRKKKGIWILKTALKSTSSEINECRVSLTVLNRTIYRRLFSKVKELSRINSPCCYRVNEEAEFRLEELLSSTKKEYIWKVDGVHMKTANKTFHHIFKKPGSYVVSVWNNQTSWSHKKKVSIQANLTKLEINKTLHHESHDLGQSLSFQVIVNSKEGVRYLWDFGDGASESTSKDILTHRYHKSGKYTMTVVASNYYSNIKNITNVNINLELCDEGTISTSFKDGLEVIQYRNRPIFLEVSTLNLICSDAVSIVFFWKTANFTDEWKDWLFWEETFNFNGKKWDCGTTGNECVNSIYIPENVLARGKYRFSVEINVNGVNLSNVKNFSTTIVIEETPLRAIIRGGAYRYVTGKSNVLFDATPSYDPENTNATLRFEWFINEGKDVVSNASMFYLMQHSLRYVTVKVSVGNRSRTTSQHVEIVNEADCAQSDIILDFLSRDMGNTSHVNPSRPLRVIESFLDENTQENCSTWWKFFAFRTSYGNTKLRQLDCTQVNLTNENIKKRRWRFDYNLVECSKASKKPREYKEQSKCSVPSCKESPKSLKTVQIMLDDFDYHNHSSSLLLIKKNTLPQRQQFSLNRTSEETTMAGRSFYVEDIPYNYSCEVRPSTENGECEIFCDIDKNANLIYNILLKRSNGYKSRFFLQRMVPRFKVQLPFNGEDDLFLYLSIEDKIGTVREYCGINVTNFLVNASTVDYLYNRTLAINMSYPRHPFAYHSQILYDISLIADALVSAPTYRVDFDIHRQIKTILLDLLGRVTISNTYIAMQHAKTLEMCTGILGEVDSSKTIEYLDKNTKSLRNDESKRAEEIDEQFSEDIEEVANKTISSVKNHTSKYKVINSLHRLYEAILWRKIVHFPPKFEQRPYKKFFSACLLKYSPYRNESVQFPCGNESIFIATKGIVAKKDYECHLFGCGLQFVKFDFDPFHNGETYQAVSSLIKLKKQCCRNIPYCGEKITKLGMQLKPNMKIFTNNLSWSSYVLRFDEMHLFMAYVDAGLYVQVLPFEFWPSNLKLQLEVRCNNETLVQRTRMEPLEQLFSSVNFTTYCKKLKFFVSIHWNHKPTRCEKMESNMKYKIRISSFRCLAKSGDSKIWQDVSVNCTLLNFSFYFSFPYIRGSEHSYIITSEFATKTLKENITKSKREKNNVVYIILLSFVVVYFAAIVVLLIKERKQIKDSSPILLELCDPSHTHKYEITVYTGHCFGAGTTAKVALVLHGRNNSSYPVELYLKNRDIFRRNSKDVFIVSVRENLGTLDYIHVWHDNSGSSPSWFVNTLAIKDLKTKETWMFDCSRWLAVDKGDGVIDCRVKPCDSNIDVELKGFKLTFEANLMDFHLWLSLFTMPLYSLFTSAERLTCCITSICCFLYFNAYLYEKYFMTRTCFSMFESAIVQQLKIGSFGSLASFPISAFFAIIFRHTKSFLQMQVSRKSKYTSSCLDASQRSSVTSSTASTTSYTTDETCAKKEKKIHPSTSLPCSLSCSRLPLCFDVFSWVGCLLIMSIFALHTIKIVTRFDEILLGSYFYSLFWSFCFSIFISQPCQAFVVTVIQMIHKHLPSMIYSYYELEDDVFLDDSSFPSFTERNVADPIYRKLLCLKYLQPLSDKVVKKERARKFREKTTESFLRDTVLYFIVALFLIVVNPFWNQQNLLIRDHGLKTFFSSETKVSSLPHWWSNTPQNFLKTLTFDEETLIIRAFSSNSYIVVGKPLLSFKFWTCLSELPQKIRANPEKRSTMSCSEREENIAVERSQKNSWFRLNSLFVSSYSNSCKSECPKDMSLQFVVFSRSSHLFSLVKLSSRSPVSITTINFQTHITKYYCWRTLVQLLFTLAPLLLFIHSLYYKTMNVNKRKDVVYHLESLIMIALPCCVILMWIWINHQYDLWSILVRYQYEADVKDNIKIIHKYQEIFKFSLGFMLFFVVLKLSHVIAINTYCQRYVQTVQYLTSALQFPMFGIFVVLIGFAHVAVFYAFFDLKNFTSLANALLMLAATFRSAGSNNLIQNNFSSDEIYFVLYVIAFCFVMLTINSLIKAIFCQFHVKSITCRPPVFKKMPIKQYLRKKIEMFFSLFSREKNGEEEIASKRVPMSYIFKELDEQLSELDFRLAQIMNEASLPPKIVEDEDVSSYDSFCGSEHFQQNQLSAPSDDDQKQTKEKGDFEHSSESLCEVDDNLYSIASLCDSKITISEIESPNLSSRRLPFTLFLHEFPKPINETVTSINKPRVLLNAWAEEESLTTVCSVEEEKRSFTEERDSLAESDTDCVFAEVDEDFDRNLVLRRPEACLNVINLEDYSVEDEESCF